MLRVRNVANEGQFKLYEISVLVYIVNLKDLLHSQTLEVNFFCNYLQLFHKDHCSVFRIHALNELN